MSKIARGFRFTVSAVSAIACGVIIVMGALGISSAVIPVCGGLAIIPCVLILIENTKLLNDLRKGISQLKRDLKEFGEKLDMLNETSESLKHENSNYKSHNMELKALLSDAEVKIDQLSIYLDEYKDSNREFKKNLESSEQNLDELRKRAEELLKIKDAYEGKISELNQIISQIQQKLVEITDIKEDYEEKIEMMEQRNNELGIVSDELKKELGNLKAHYEKAKQVIESLISAKNVLEEVHDNMIKTATDMEDLDDDIREKLEKYDEMRNSELFQHLDENKDGNLSLEEFLGWYGGNRD